MLRDSKHLYLDHDFVETGDGWIFGVVSNTHPPGRILAYLKYIPGDGVWTRDGIAYKRVLATYSMREVVQMVESVRKSRPEYVYMDPSTGEEFVYVPVERVVKHYRCEEGLTRILERPVNRVEAVCAELVNQLSSLSGLSYGFFGVSGSLLLRLFNPAADIDLVVYGGENFRKVVEASYRLQTEKTLAENQAILVKNYMAKYPITQEEAEELAKRCRTRGIFHGTYYSLHAVRTLRENKRSYGEVTSRYIGVEKTILRITDASESVFTPAVYGVEDLGGKNVEQLVCYDTTFAGLFNEGEVVEALGKLEKTVDHVENRVYLSLVIGTIRTADIEYVKPLRSV
ncbi:MAG: hypothetical protein QXD24_01025 [Candidatus Caldarchaeum sp.]